jgi:ABC-type uncharacterized transport system substrate-binding protein
MKPHTIGAHLNLLIHKANEDKIPLTVTDYSMVQQGALVYMGPTCGYLANRPPSW